MKTGDIAAKIIAQAITLPPLSGRGDEHDNLVVRLCTHHFQELEAHQTIIFTRDELHLEPGRGTSRDWHLSVSIKKELGSEPFYCPILADVWVRRIFPDTHQHLWTREALSTYGKEKQVHHFCLFVGPDWKTPEPGPHEFLKLHLQQDSWRPYKPT